MCESETKAPRNTLLKKPGAIRNSVALKSIPRLKAIFDIHFSKNPRKFIELFLENKDLSIDEIIKLFEEKKRHKAEINALDVVKPVSDVDVSIRAYMSNYTTLIYGGINRNDEHRRTGEPVEADIYTG